MTPQLFEIINKLCRVTLAVTPVGGCLLSSEGRWDRLQNPQPDQTGRHTLSQPTAVL